MLLIPAHSGAPEYPVERLPAQRLPLNQVVIADAANYLLCLPSNSVDCIVTSPPYFNQRDYGIAGQIGLEGDVQKYVDNLVNIFRLARRVLKDTGTFWLNIGDSYSHSGKGGGGKNGYCYVNSQVKHTQIRWDIVGFPRKTLIGIPWRLALALQADNWILRTEVIWDKTNGLPESVKDRPTRTHEYIFMFTKSQRYFYNLPAVSSPPAPVSVARAKRGRSDQHKNVAVPGQATQSLAKSRAHDTARSVPTAVNQRNIWRMSTANTSEKHHATFPLQLPRQCILSSCPPDGVVLDMFMGAGTTAMAAIQLGMNYVGCELNPDYAAIARRRIAKYDPYQHTPIAIAAYKEPPAQQLSLFGV
jgi:DNA modification methylase